MTHRLLQVLVVIIAMLPTFAVADVIHFKSGATREATIVSETDDAIVYRDPVTGSETRLPRNLVERIERTTPPPNQTLSPTDKTVSDAAAAFDQGRWEEALGMYIRAVRSRPGDGQALAPTFSSIVARQYALARRTLETDRASTRHGHEALLRLLEDTAATNLDHPSGSLQRMQQAVKDDLAYILVADAATQPPNALELLQNAARLSPSNADYQARLARAARQAGDNATALAAYRAVAALPNVPDALRTEADQQLAALAAGSPAPTPSPQVVPSPTPTPPVITPAVAVMTPIPQPVSVQAQPVPSTPATDILGQPISPEGLWARVRNEFANFNWRELPSRIQGWVNYAIQAGWHTILGIVVVAFLILHTIPNLFLKWRSRHGDIVAAENRMLARRFGFVALIPYTIRALKTAPTKNRCPFCNKGIDNIEAYSDLNFYVCPHCHENITPIYDLKDYVSHLLQQLEFEFKRSKDRGGESVLEKDAMQKLVRAILTLAVRRRASDLHLDTEADGALLRARIDGMMYEMLVMAKPVGIAFISALKIMANLDITERRVPQDGKASLWVDKNDLDLRINTSPASLGEKVSIRILNQKQIQVDPTKLGMDGDHLERFQRAIHRPHGLIIVTGPSGSGKSTTLYVALNEINTGEQNIVTIEDPIEYQLKGISQMQVNPAANFTFATGLRSILRQDPDVIMVGEIRDKETAVIAVEAAMTGHLVFTTLHTIDAPTAFGRLADMNVETRRLAESVICLLGQRLVRTICPDCRKPYKPKKADIELLHLADTEVTYVHGTGCDSCMNTGYQGRIGIFEFLIPDDAIREVLETRATVSVLRELARKAGYRPMREEGIIRIVQGSTTVEEVIRVTS